ncbi:MAG: sugar transferase, partial [Bacteroidota bacterium]
MSYGQTTKRLLDILLLLAVLPFALPVLLVLLIAGMFAFDGKPMFTQVRPGKDTEAFLLLKLRSMRDLKDASGHQLPDEQRITPYGRWLRRSSLDELPQLLNILQGDMSFVGPRPLLQAYLPFYTAEELRRH